MINVQNLCKSYNGFNVLQNINLHVRRGEIFGIVGQSGAGKSTLLRCINGLEAFDKGKLIVDNTDISLLSAKELRLFRRKIGMIFQNFALLNRKTVLDNVLLPMECWHYPRTEMANRAERLLELVGLAGKRNALPHELSGGQKQRVAIARALTLEPDILLCDEATSALDPAITQSILDLLAELNARLGITIVIVAHDMAVIKAVCERMAIITGNRIAVAGSVADIFLAEPPDLCELVGKKAIVAEPGRAVMRISIRDAASDQAFLVGLFEELRLDFSILSADINQFQHKSYGHLDLSIAAEDLARTRSFCESRAIVYKVFAPEGRPGGSINVL